MSFFRRIVDLVVGRPAGGLPKHYAKLTPTELERFFSDAEFERAGKFENAYVLPMIGDAIDPQQAKFGIGLSRLLIRNLMLLRTISIHGPEDTPLVTSDGAIDLSEANARSTYVTGNAASIPGRFTLDFQVRRNGRAVKRGRVDKSDFRDFLEACSTEIAEGLGCPLDSEVAVKWRVGRPRKPESLTALGELHLDLGEKQTAERTAAARRILQTDPDFATAAWDVEPDAAGAVDDYRAGLDRDPYNAQLCYLMFRRTRRSEGPQPEALQYCRRAIELSPGHGKAHMCAPHAAQDPASLLRHAELGYRLLPGDSLAVSNYANHLTRSGAPTEQLIELAEEGIADDPNDPVNYERIIELCVESGDYRGALQTAERLQRLFEPRINERAMTCLRRNPERARQIEKGEYNPAVENRRRIVELRGRTPE